MIGLLKPTAEEIAEVAAIFPESDPRHEQLLKLIDPQTEDGANGNISI
jgi:hypothetical protein